MFCVFTPVSSFSPPLQATSIHPSSCLLLDPQSFSMLAAEPQHDERLLTFSWELPAVSLRLSASHVLMRGLFVREPVSHGEKDSNILVKIRHFRRAHGSLSSLGCVKLALHRPQEHQRILSMYWTCILHGFLHF